MLKYHVLVVTDRTNDELTRTYFGRTRADLMRQFRDAYAEFIEDWAWMDDNELTQRVTHGGLGMFFDEYELPSADDPVVCDRETEDYAIRVAGVFQDRGYDHGLDLYYRSDGEEIIVVCDGGPKGQVIATVMLGYPAYYIEIASSAQERGVLARTDAGAISWRELEVRADGDLR